ncbi:hypothetical protein GCM10022244_00200 [Streptomyces gulbargensis]|uniref:Uncharacterized protein n=1 Tax=Streptomyces gulbargensis TaxID=364901 RepID=A0ABP7L5Q9_9ACTN
MPGRMSVRTEPRRLGRTVVRCGGVDPDPDEAAGARAELRPVVVVTPARGELQSPPASRVVRREPRRALSVEA